MPGNKEKNTMWTTEKVMLFATSWRFHGLADKTPSFRQTTESHAGTGCPLLGWFHCMKWRLRRRSLFALVSALMRKRILEISVILKTRMEKCSSLYCCLVEASATPTHSSHFIRISQFDAMHLTRVATIIHKLIKPDWLLLGDRGRGRGDMKGCTVNNLRIINRKINKT